MVRSHDLIAAHTLLPSSDAHDSLSRCPGFFITSGFLLGCRAWAPGSMCGLLPLGVVRVGMCACSSFTVSPSLLFCFGCLVGFLQLIVSPKSALYSNVFEVSAVVVVSFLARAFGSLSNGNLFCFSALAQGGIVMLLPGYLVCKSLVTHMFV